MGEEREKEKKEEKREKRRGRKGREGRGRRKKREGERGERGRRKERKKGEGREKEGQLVIGSSIIGVSKYIAYPTGRKFLLEFKFRYFANGKFAKVEFHLIL